MPMQMMMGPMGPMQPGMMMMAMPAGTAGGAAPQVRNLSSWGIESFEGGTPQETSRQAPSGQAVPWAPSGQAVPALLLHCVAPAPA